MTTIENTTMTTIDNLRKLLFFNPTTQKFMVAFIGILLIVAVMKIVKKRLFKRIKSENWYKTRKAINVTSYILIIFLLGIVLSDRLGGIAVTLGFAGAGITFALREVITSVAGWFAILGGGFYKTGERVQLGGIKGDVIDIGVLRTTVMELGEWVDGDQYTGRIVKIANSFVFSQPVFNYSADFPFLWDEIKIPIRYGSDYQMTQRILEKVADGIVGNYTEQAKSHWAQMMKKYIIEDQSLLSTVTIKTTDNWVEFTLRYVVDYKKRRSIRNTLFTKILKEIDSTNGAIQYASTTIEIKDGEKF